MTRLRALAFIAPMLSTVLFADAARADDAACVDGAEKALALRDQGKLKEALASLAICSDPSCPQEVSSECSRRIEAINRALPSIVLAAKDGSGNNLSRVKVSIDGALAAEVLDGRPLTVNPGEHTFRFEVIGQAPLEKKFVVREGEKDWRETVTIGLPAVAQTTSPPPPTTLPPPPPPPPSSWNGRKTLAVVTGAAGLVGVGLGIGFGAFASSAQSSEKNHCSSASCTNYPQAVEDYNTANKDATGSTIFWIAGAVFLAGGIVLWVTAPSGSSSSGRGLRLTPLVGARSGGLSFGGDL